MRWKILPNGDLEIRINEQEQAQLREDRANAADWVTYYTPVEQAWYFEPYAVRSPQEDLADTGRCVFKKAEPEE